MLETETFFAIENAAQSGAFGNARLKNPTEAQCKAGNYKHGRACVHGMNISIERPRHSYREGVNQLTGKTWRNRLSAHYGYFVGTKGNDGDGVDVFIGFFPQSEHAYIINQHVNGRFDEHKVMLAFPDEESAKRAYLDSYDKGWNGLHSIVKATNSQLKWWLKHGNMKQPVSTEHLPFDGLESMNTTRIFWDSVNQPTNVTLDRILYDIRRSDGGEKLLLDAVTMDDIFEDVESILAFDALVTPYAKLERKMDMLQTVMNRVGGGVKPISMQISDPYRQLGVAQVAVIFELSDGQTITVFFHNPDANPKKITPTDEVISWKWMLNKKDITIVVAPERGQDLNIRNVAQRVVKLAEKNSAAFARANEKRAERMQLIDGLKGEIVVLEKRLVDVQNELDAAKVEAEDSEANPVVAAENNDTSTIEITGNELGEFPDTEEGKIALRESTKAHLENNLRGKWILCKAINEEVEMRQRGIDESIFWSAKPKKLKALAVIDKIISGAHSPDYQPNTKKKSKPQVLEYIHLKNTVLIDGDPVVFNVIIERDADGLLHYDIVIFEEKLTAALDSASAAAEWQTTPDTKSGICHTLNIGQQLEKVNDSITLDAVTKSRMVLNLFIEGEEPEYIDVETDDNGSQEQPENTNDPAAKVDAAYPFTATDDFKEWLAESVDKTSHSPFATAKAMTEEAKRHGADIEWGFFGSGVMDSIDFDENPSIEAVLDSVLTLDSTEGDSYVGKIINSGIVIGRIDMGDDGKAMVFLGASGSQRVKYKSADGEFKDALYSDDDAALMVNWLFTVPANGVANEPETENEQVQIPGDSEVYDPPKSEIDVQGEDTNEDKNEDKLVAPKNPELEKQDRAMSPLDAFENAGKEPWQVTQAEWVNIMRGHMQFLGQTGSDTDYEQFHQGAVKSALDAKKPVPENVLADYPGMVAETEQEKEQRYADAEKNLNRLMGIAAGNKKQESPELVKQRAKLDNLITLQNRMKAANKVVKSKKLSDEQKIEQLQAQGFTEGQASELLKPDFAGRIGFADYKLTNNNATIRNTKKRVAELEAKALAESMASKGASETSHEFDGGSIELDYSSDRLRVYFDVKPDRETIDKLKSNGFKWSPTNTAWQRQLTDNAISTANYLFGTEIKTAAKAMSEQKNNVDESKEPNTPVSIPADSEASDPQPNKAVVSVEEDPQSAIKTAFIAELEALKAETDIIAFDERLDDIVARVEQAGLMEALDKELNDTADVLTDLLAEAENA